MSAIFLSVVLSGNFQNPSGKIFSEVSLIPVFNKVSQNFSENACDFSGRLAGN
jgi:hypothetical protein